MIHQKNCFAALTALLLAVSVSACSSKPTEMAPTEPSTAAAVKDSPAPSEVPAETEPETEAPAADVLSMDVLSPALANTVWAGVNGERGAFAVAFGEKSMTYVTQDGDTIEGFWSVTPEDKLLHICSDEALTNELRSMPFSYLPEEKVLKLADEVYMVQTDNDAASEAGQLANAFVTYSQQLQNAYWGGGDENFALIFMLRDDGTCDIHYYDAVNGDINETTFYWGMNSQTLSFFDETFHPSMQFTWSMQDGSLSLNGKDAERSLTCTELLPEEAQDVSYQLGVLAGAYEPGAAISAEDGYVVDYAE